MEFLKKTRICVTLWRGQKLWHLSASLHLFDGFVRKRLPIRRGLFVPYRR
jgi:hypothetical protein